MPIATSDLAHYFPNYFFSFQVVNSERFYPPEQLDCIYQKVWQ